MKKLISVVESKWRSKYSVEVLEGYIGVKMSRFSELSLHYEGRALDVTLCINNATKKTSRLWKNTEKYQLLQHRLAFFAYHKAGFNFVEFKRKTLHMSCRRA